jgi:hypothetical protein
MKTKAPAIRSAAEPASGPPAITLHSSQAMGRRTASEPRPTIAIGRSRSSSASAWPPRRAALAAIAERIPPSTGPAILSSVQTAATPITPAPKKRTSRVKMVRAHSSGPPGSGLWAVRIGSRTHQPITRPRNIAAPTEIPTRWPTPISAKERPPEIPVAPAPARNQAEASAATSRVWVRIAKPAETRLLQTSTERPLALSSSPARLFEPT